MIAFILNKTKFLRRYPSNKRVSSFS